MANLVYKGTATFLRMKKDDKVYYLFDPEEFDKRIFLSKNCKVLDSSGKVDVDELRSDCLYNCECSCNVSISESGYLNFNAYLVELIN